MVHVIILAGGKGTRVGADIPKQFVQVKGKPIIAYTLDIFQKCEKIDSIIIACVEGYDSNMWNIVKKYNYTKVKGIIAGGSNWNESVMQGMVGIRQYVKEVNDEDVFLIHTAVSPMTSMDVIDDAIAVCMMHGNAISVDPIIFSTCIADDECFSLHPIDKKQLRALNVPWAFCWKNLKKYYETDEAKKFWDDDDPYTTSIAMAMGEKIYFSKGVSNNLKITTKEDIILFEALLDIESKR